MLVNSCSSRCRPASTNPKSVWPPRGGLLCVKLKYTAPRWPEACETGLRYQRPSHFLVALTYDPELNKQYLRASEAAGKPIRLPSRLSAARVLHHRPIYWF